MKNGVKEARESAFLAIHSKFAWFFTKFW